MYYSGALRVYLLSPFPRPPLAFQRHATFTFVLEDERGWRVYPLPPVDAELWFSVGSPPLGLLTLLTVASLQNMRGGMKKQKLDKEKDRDISEKIALGMHKGSGAKGGEGL